MKTMLSAAVAAVAIAAATPAAAAKVERVTFDNAGEELVGELYLPDGYTRGQRLPTVVVTGAWMTVRQQMPASYARELADRGYAAFIFDFRGWGESGGARRQFEDPQGKIADISAAVRYVATRPEVDADRIGGLGICASAGYMVTAAADTLQLRSVALVAPWLHDREIVLQTYGGAEAVAKLEAVGDAAEAEYRRSGEQSFVPAASLTDSRAIMYQAPYYTEADRGMIPAWRNAADPAFWRGWLGFDAMPAAARLSQPFLMVHSEAAAIPQGARRFFAQLTGPKQELWLENVGQLDFYDRDQPFTAAAAAVARHFRETL